MTTAHSDTDRSVEDFRRCLESGLLMLAPDPAARRELLARYVDGHLGRIAALEVVLDRRSAGRLTGPAPTDEQLEVLIAAAATVPDHGRLRPWRFVVVTGASQHRFADALAAGAGETDPDLAPERREKARGKAFAAPASIAIIASCRSGTKVPEWEQVASACCAGYAITLAAHALGLGAVWKSVPFVAAPAMRACFGLADGESLLGWVNVGQHGGPPPARPDDESPWDHVSFLAA